jgi:hypothetical protein
MLKAGENVAEIEDKQMIKLCSNDHYIVGNCRFRKILTTWMQAEQHPQKVALGVKTAFCDAQIRWSISMHVTLSQLFGGQTISDAVQTQTARRVNSSFI